MKPFRITKKQAGFSLLELAISIVIIGMVVSAVAVGRNTMRSGEAFKAYQQFINPWTQSAIQRFQNTGLSGFGTTGGLNSDPYNFGGGTISRQSATYAEGMVTVVFALSESMRVDALEELQGVVENGFESARRMDFTQSSISVAFELAGVNQTTGSEVGEEPIIQEEEETGPFLISDMLDELMDPNWVLTLGRAGYTPDTYFQTVQDAVVIRNEVLTTKVPKIGGGLMSFKFDVDGSMEFDPDYYGPETGILYEAGEFTF
ncbi:MAG: prepilin-type N-terminal cleavage/methylation domain-containing protein [Magnetococcales bacterium]|nr:prepilin-type N-terminal cleavage/methylation domain-containing protein [Magnetococcales bacterium]